MYRSLWHIAAAALLLYPAAGPLAAQQQTLPPAVKAAENSIDPEKIRAHVKFLADDLLEGRGPGVRGGELAAKYIATEFALHGLTPGGDNGTYFQQADFFGVTVNQEQTKFELAPKSTAAMPLKFGVDYVVFNPRHTPVVDVNAPIVFVGYGVTAPEYGWNDYAGVDVKGKVVLAIVGDPPSDDPKFFAGTTLTYYGRWTYKFEQAARMGAVAAIVIHRTDLASYPWSVVQNSNTGEKTFLANDQNAKVGAAAWISHEAADRLFAAAGMPDTDAEIAVAGKRGFKAIELPIRLDAHIEAAVRAYQSPNVIGLLPGQDVGGREQAVLYTAHYDHLGMDPSLPGDKIYNGAVDNATGCGILMELARAWSSTGSKPPHTVIFAAVTAEEQGLLGSEYLGQHPPIPAKDIVLDLNYDALQPLGDPLEVSVVGAERTSFYPTVESVAQQFGMKIVPDAHPEAGDYYRSDHFSLARVGIPAFSIDEGTLYAGHDAAWGLAKEDDYTAHRYHTPNDNYTPDMDFTGDAKMAKFGMTLGWDAITAPSPVEWRVGDEFEAARKQSKGR